MGFMKQIKIPKKQYNDISFFYLYDLKQLPLSYVKSCLEFLKKRELKRNTITITGLDLLKAMKNAKTPLNPFLIKKVKNYDNIRKTIKRTF